MAMKGSKKKLSACLALMLAIAFVLTSCAGNDSGKTATSVATTTTAANTTTAAAATAATTTAAANTTTAAVTTAAADVVTLTYLCWDHGSWVIKNDTPVLQAIKDRIGVEIDYIPLAQDSADQKLNTIFASGDMPDLMTLTMDKAKQVGSNVLIDYKDYIDSSMPSVKKLTEELTSYIPSVSDMNGAIFGIPLYGICEIKMGLDARQDLMEKYDIADPTNLDEFKTMLETLQKNEPDCIPLGAQPNYVTLLMVFAPIFGLSPENMKDYGDGKLVLNATQDTYKEMLLYLNDLYNEKLLDQEYTVRTSQGWEEAVSTGKMAVFTGYAGRSDSFNNSSLKGTDMYFKCLPLIEGPDGDKGMAAYSKMLLSYANCITKSCTNIDVAIKYVDFLMSDEGMVLTQWGIEGETYTVNGGKKQLIDSTLATDMNKQAEFGIGQPMFPRRNDPEWIDQTLGVETKKAIEMYSPYFIYPLPSLNYTEDENTERADLWTNLNEYINEYTHNMITGKVNATTDWDTFQSNLKSMGVDRYMEIINVAYARYLDSMK
ncbi:MAG: extracellular solute-binding protein [Clostridiaceae bacterium]|nr:extracellular solute-binding protein [Clostridiaceae bacterium]